MWVLDVGMLLCAPIYVWLCSRWLGLIDWKHSTKSAHLNAGQIALGLGGGLVASVAVNLLIEQIGPTDLLENQFLVMSRRPLAWIYIGITSPICEELVFRGGILNYLKKQGLRPLWAIVVSSVLFALIHMNPAQMVAGCLLGVVLGLLYHRTGNILLCGSLHILNNLLGLISMLIWTDPDATPLSDFIGSAPLCWLTMAVLAVASAAMLRQLFRHDQHS